MLAFNNRGFVWLFSSNLPYYSARTAYNFDLRLVLYWLILALWWFETYSCDNLTWLLHFLCWEFHSFWRADCLFLLVYLFFGCRNWFICDRPRSWTTNIIQGTIRLLMVRLNFYISFFLLLSLSISSLM